MHTWEVAKKLIDAPVNYDPKFDLNTFLEEDNKRLQDEIELENKKE